MSDRMAIMQQLKGQTRTHDCPSCSGPAYCAMEAGKSANTCWCMTLPRDHKPESSDMGSQCLCRSCLTKQKEKGENNGVVVLDPSG